MRTPPEGLPRLLAEPAGAAPGDRGTGPADRLAGHLDRHGPLPYRGRGGGAGAASRGAGLLIDSVERAGLTGRGGAGFPAARKMCAVRENSRAAPGGRGRAVVVANGVESEPLSAKDRVLLAISPHLVLDGISLAAESVGAGEAFLCVDEHEHALRHQLGEAVAARQRAGIDPVPIRIAAVPGHYVASEESALVHALNGGPARPAFVPPRPFAKGVRGRPTLINNVETLAHVALIARYGPAWFRSAGSAAATGSALITVTGAVAAPGVQEIALGTPAKQVLAAAGGTTHPPLAVLTGGCFGGWLGAAAVPNLAVSGPDLLAAGTPMGAGVLGVLPQSSCGIVETALIARYLAGQSAGQCGPCLNGLPAIADALEHLAWRGRDARAREWLVQLLGLVEGRGACHLPNGAARLVATALRVFAADLREHVSRGPCERAQAPAVLLPPGASAHPGHQHRRAAARV